MPIVATTAKVFTEDRARCLGAGMTAFIAKPVDPHILDRSLLHYLTVASTESTSSRSPDGPR